MEGYKTGSIMQREASMPAKDDAQHDEMIVSSPTDAAPVDSFRQEEFGLISLPSPVAPEKCEAHDSHSDAAGHALRRVTHLTASQR